MSGNSTGPLISVMLAVAAGADGSVEDIKNHERPWGVHRQGGFTERCAVTERSIAT